MNDKVATAPCEDEDRISVEDALKIAESLKKTAAIGAPSSIPRRNLASFLTQELAKAIAYHPGTPNSAYVEELMRNGIAKRNAKKITWNARKLAATIEAPVVVQQPTASPATKPAHVQAPASGSGVVVVGKENWMAPVPAPETASGKPEETEWKPNLAFTGENNSYALGHWSDYILSIPATLPKPKKPLEFEPNINERKKMTLKSIRKDIFNEEYGLLKRLEHRCEVTAQNPKGFYEPHGHGATMKDFSTYSEVRTAIGENRIEATHLAEFLPYLAEEGLLEYHKVPLKVVQDLEELRQGRIAMGTIPEYNPDVGPTLPRTGGAAKG